MKINKQQNPILRKRIVIPVAAALVIIIGTLSYLYISKTSFFGWQPSPTTHGTQAIDYNKPTPEQVAAGDQTKQQALANKSANSGTDQPPAPAPAAQPNGKGVVEVIITAANQTSSALQIRTQISTATDTGTCTVTLTKSGATTVTQTAAVQPLATVTSCKGFDVPTSQLSTGSWHIALHFENASLTGDATKDVNIQ